MPDPDIGGLGGGGLSTDTRRKKREDQFGLDQLTHVERVTHGTLPTHVSWALSSMRDRQEAIEKAAKLIARKFDVDHRYIFGAKDLKDYLDPIYDGAIKMQTIRRITGDFQVPALEAILRDAATVKHAPHGGRGIDTTQKAADPRRVATFARAFAPYIDSHNINATEGISMAVYLATHSKGVNIELFKNNLGQIYKWAADTGRDEEFGWQELLLIAKNAAQQKVTLKGNTDVVAYLNPELGNTAAAEAVRLRQQELQKNALGYDPVQQRISQAYEERSGPTPQNMTADFNALAFTAAGDIVFKALDDVKVDTEDFFAYNKALEEQLRLDEEGFQRSWFGTALRQFGLKMNAIWEGTEKGIITVGTGIDLAGKGLGAALPGGPSFQDAYRATVQDRQYLFQRINQGDSIGDVVSEGFGLPEWMGAAFDFGVGWVADPFVLGGKLKAVAREVRLFPGTTERLSLASRILPEGETSVWTTETEALTGFAGSKASRELFEAIDSNASLYRRMEQLRTTVEARSPLDLEYIKGLRDRLLNRYGLENIQNSATIAEEAWKEWQQGIIAHFVGFGPVGSVAEEAWKLRMGLRLQSGEELLGALPGKGFTGEQLELPFEGIITPAEAATDVVERMWGGGWHPPLRQEIPLDAHWVPGLGFTQKLATAFPAKFGETAFGRATERLFSFDPGRQMNFASNPERYVLLHGRRGGLPESTVRLYQSKALEILNSGVGVENRLSGLIDDMNEEVFQRALEGYNVSPTAVEELRNAIFEDVREVNAKKQAFGVKNGKAIESPLLETQLRNTRLVVDPIQIQKAVKRYVGTLRRLHDALVEHLPIGQKKLITEAAHGRALSTLYDTSGDVARAYRRTWKAGAVARPGYIPRVILLDENARFLSTVQSLTERVMSQRTFARLTGGESFWDTVIKVGDEEVRIPVPGKYDYEPLAVGKVRETELIDDMVKGSFDWNKAMKADGGWGVVTPAKGELYWNSLARTLQKEFANSSAGSVVLESVHAGQTVGQTEQALLRWAREDNYVTLESRLGISRDGVKEWASDLAQLGHSYTGGMPEVAAAAIGKADDFASLLKAKMRTGDLGPESLPDVHGPSANSLTGGSGDPITKRVTDRAYKMFVQSPEDVLNRQPFYKAWKRRAEVSYYRALGKDVEASFKEFDDLKAGLEKFVDDRINPTLALGDEAYVRKSLRAAQSLRGAGEDLGNGIRVLRKADGKRYFSEIEDGQVVGFRSVSKDGRVETIVDPAYQKQGLGLKLLKAHFADEGVTTIDQAKALIGKQQFTEAGAALNKKYLRELAESAHPGSALTADVTRAIDVASRDFALAQVKKIMFEFTEQRRFQELASFMFPFSQPFFEGFQAWGNIALRRAPETIGRVRQLWMLGQQTGFIREDQYGNQVIPLTALFKPFMWTGLIPDDFAFTTPVSSLNMLAQSTIPVGPKGFLGKVAGGTPIPIPSVDPLAMFTFQRMFSDSNNDAINAAFFQHGPNTSLLPPTLYKVLSILDPDATGNDERINAYALNFLEFYQYAGLHQNLSTEELKAQARADAKDLNTYRTLVSLISPGAPQVTWPQTEVKQEFYDDIETFGYEDGKAKFLEKHPDLWLLTLGHTVWTKDFEGRDQVRIPTSKYAAKLLSSGPLADIARRYPEYGALFLIGADPELAQKYDFATAARLAAAGVTRYKSLDRFLDEGESSAAWTEVDKFNQTYYRNLDALNEQGLGDDNAAVVALRQSRIEFLTGLNERFPLWGRDNLKPVVDSDGKAIGYDWKYEGDTPPPTLILAHARQLVAIPELRNFPGIKALGMYLEGRDAIAEKMAKLGISDLGSRAAQENGIVESYDKLRADIIEQYPDFAPFVYNYFKGDLTGTPSNDLAGAFKLDQETYDKVVNLDTRYEKLTDKGREADLKWERSAAYQDARDLLDRKYAQDPQLVKTWWQTQLTPQEREDYKTNLAFRPVAFYSRWDFKQFGVNINDKAANVLTQYAEARVDIQRKDELNPEFSAGDAYDKLDRWLIAQSKGNKGIRTAIDAMNTWGWGAEKAGLTEQPGKTGSAWKHVIDGARALQGAYDRGDITPYDPEWQRGRLALLDYVKEWRKFSPGFDAQWQDYQETNNSGEPLIYWLVPDIYFPIDKGGS